MWVLHARHIRRIFEKALPRESRRTISPSKGAREQSVELHASQHGHHPPSFNDPGSKPSCQLKVRTSQPDHNDCAGWNALFSHGHNFPRNKMDGNDRCSSGFGQGVFWAAHERGLRRWCLSCLYILVILGVFAHDIDRNEPDHEPDQVTFDSTSESLDNRGLAIAHLPADGCAFIRTDC